MSGILLRGTARIARLDAADLRGALFLTQAQITAAHGSSSTRLPIGVGRPGHWVPGSPTAAARTAEAP
ncbi:hypothetical protein ACFFGR_16140 [Arthrobacter liuii]|uniref:Pentapeptide repeat-containing protein n=1 Tax=Arthrobacter liuii TaxID=1476996 RepID=A0ABQ2ATC3_9MICC|nr:hypothetical protein [Arthrobacter liuii]GGH95518.1 hypothetical protein GCM10007170_21230 [Arthrobacter liuii]